MAALLLEIAYTRVVSFKLFEQTAAEDGLGGRAPEPGVRHPRLLKNLTALAVLRGLLRVTKAAARSV